MILRFFAVDFLQQLFLSSIFSSSFFESMKEINDNVSQEPQFTQLRLTI